MSLRIYVAAPMSHYAEAREIMAALRADGHTITHDWTPAGDRVPAPERHLSIQDQRDLALGDMRGVWEAHLLLALAVADHSLGCGMWIEVGYALGIQRRLVIVGPSCGRSIFCHLAERLCSDWRDALPYLRRATP